jgi:uncharacterized Zn finger protein
MITGRNLATTWWGKSWNSNLERYADYSNRIGRGRSCMRHRAVLDLQLKSGCITALVQGSEAQPYRVAITVATLSAHHWAAIRDECAGCFDSLSELLAGTFPQALKDLFFAKGAGLFPSPRDIHFDCSCPDWASMCIHVAAALYGVGARFDHDPALFFTLRGITLDDLITTTVADTTQALLRQAERPRTHVLDDIDLGEVFGIALDGLPRPRPVQLPVPARPSTRAIPATPGQKARADKTRGPAGLRRAAQRHPTSPPRAVRPTTAARRLWRRRPARLEPCWKG